MDLRVGTNYDVTVGGVRKSYKLDLCLYIKNQWYLITCDPEDKEQIFFIATKEGTEYFVPIEEASQNMLLCENALREELVFYEIEGKWQAFELLCRMEYQGAFYNIVQANLYSQDIPWMIQEKKDQITILQSHQSPYASIWKLYQKINRYHITELKYWLDRGEEELDQVLQGSIIQIDVTPESPILKAVLVWDQVIYVVLEQEDGLLILQFCHESTFQTIHPSMKRKLLNTYYQLECDILHSLCYMTFSEEVDMWLLHFLS